VSMLSTINRGGRGLTEIVMVYRVVIVVEHYFGAGRRGQVREKQGLLKGGAEFLVRARKELPRWVTALGGREEEGK